MNTISGLFTSLSHFEFIPQMTSAWGWALLHFIWQGGVLGVITFALLKILKNARAQIRYALACIALMICLLLPIFNLQKSLSITTIQNSAIVVDASTSSATVAPNINYTSPWVPSRWNTKLELYLPWMVLLWSLGAAMFALRMTIGLSWIATIRRQAEHSSNPKYQTIVDHFARRLRLNQSIPVLLTRNGFTPIVMGWIKPIILIPTSLIAQLPAELIEALIAHELAHIKRNDYLINLLQTCVEAILFFHPVVWWLSKQIRVERENIADDIAAQLLGEPRRVALALQALDQYQLQSIQLAPAANGANLMSRIYRLMQPKQPVQNWKIVLPFAAMTLVCLSVFAQDVATPLTTTSQQTVSQVNPLVQNSRAKASSENTNETNVPALAGALSNIVTDDDSVTLTHGSNVDLSGKKNSSRQSFALVKVGKKGFMMSGNTEDIEDVQQIRKSTVGDFLWFRRDGKAYLIQEPSVIEAAQEAWKDSEALGEKMEIRSKEMRIHGEKMESLGRKMERLDDHHSDAMQATGQKMEALGELQAEVAKLQELTSLKMQKLSQRVARNGGSSNQSHQVELQKLDNELQAQSQQMQSLSEQMSVLSEQMEQQSRALETALSPMDELSEQMEIASQPMEALGEQMEKMGEEMDVLTQVAEVKVRKILDQSLRDGKAKPIKTR